VQAPQAAVPPVAVAPGSTLTVGLEIQIEVSIGAVTIERVS
jgi:hypothetical protein